jgi:peptide/nickel transport system permease protein
MRRGADLPLVGALFVVLALLGFALFGPRIAPHEDIYFVVEHGTAPRPYDPGQVFPLGSDILGRDLFSLVLAGAQTTLALVLLAGAARVAAGLLLAVVGAAWSPVRLFADSLAQLVAAIPATVVALLLVKVFVKADTTVLVFIGALLVIGWAGPYRIVRAELDRLARAPFTEGARALGVSDRRLFLRHVLPHLAPTLAVNLSQQIVAALLLVAELGVIGVFVGATRSVDLGESITAVRSGELNQSLIADSPEWGGLLANSRTVLALWVTRWLIFLPGAAFALTAVGVAVVGFVLARRYVRHDLIADLRGRGTAMFGIAVVALFVTSALVPERYAAARELAASARNQVARAGDVQDAFAAADLEPLGPTFGVTREATSVVRTGPAALTVGGLRFAERSPEPQSSLPDRERLVRSFVSATTRGGGVIEAPIIFLGRGITPADYPVRQQPLVFRQPDVGQLIRELDYADDYANVDVRGKIVVLVRFLGIASADATGTSSRFVDLNGYARAPLPTYSIDKAIERGATGVIFIDPALWLYNDLTPSGATYALGQLEGGANPYLRAEREARAITASGVPVVLLGDAPGKQLLGQFGIDIAPLFSYDTREPGRYATSIAQDLGVVGRIEVPVERRVASATSYVGEVRGSTPDLPRIVVWAPRTTASARPTSVVIAALARALGDRRLPLVFVDFDPGIDAAASIRDIRQAMGEREVALVVVLDELDGSALRFITPYGELVPVFDRYADAAGAAHQVTRQTARPDELAGVAPFPLVKTVVVRATGMSGDARADAAAVIGYLAGRLALGAPEVPR